MGSHIRTLAILHIVFAVISVLGGLLALAVLGGLGTLVTVLSGGADFGIGATVLGLIGGFVFLTAAFLALPGLIVGIGLLNLKPWARVCGLILSGLELLNMPVGTALGLYGLWVLLQPESERLFEQRRFAV